MDNNKGSFVMVATLRLFINRIRVFSLRISIWRPGATMAEGFCQPILHYLAQFYTRRHGALNPRYDVKGFTWAYLSNAGHRALDFY